MQRRCTHVISTICFPKEELHDDNINRNGSMMGLFLKKASIVDEEIHETNGWLERDNQFSPRKKTCPDKLSNPKMFCPKHIYIGPMIN